MIPFSLELAYAADELRKAQSSTGSESPLRSLPTPASQPPCAKKLYTKKSAKEVVKIMQNKWGDHGLAPYRCEVCRDWLTILQSESSVSWGKASLSATWHIGHPTPADKLRKRGLLV